MLPSAAAIAQSTGPIIRDPAGGSAIHDPALADPMMPGGLAASPPLRRDPAGGTMINDEVAFRNYVTAHRMRSYRHSEPVEVGTVLPSRGLVYRQVPAQYGASGYRYTVVNDQPVIVEPRTRRVVEVID